MESFSLMFVWAVKTRNIDYDDIATCQVWQVAEW